MVCGAIFFRRTAFTLGVRVGGVITFGFARKEQSAAKTECKHGETNLEEVDLFLLFFLLFFPDPMIVKNESLEDDRGKCCD